MDRHGFVSTWLPLQQEHSVGKEALFTLLRGDLHRGPMWTDAGGAPGDLLRGVADAGFGASARGMDGLHQSQPKDAPPTLWAETAKELQLSFLGLGRPSIDITTPLAHWWAPLRETVVARDAGSGYPAKIVYWSLETQDGMRKVLDLGVDGIIVDHEERLCEVLREEPYRQFCRKAAPGDWEPLQAHGIGTEGGAA